MKKIEHKNLKAKGARLERKFAKLIRFFKLDKNAKRMVLSGADWAFPSDIYTKLPFHFECKHQEKMRFWSWWQQAEGQSSGAKEPVLVHTANFRPVMVSMKAETFLNVLKEVKEYREERQSAKVTSKRP